VSYNDSELVVLSGKYERFSGFSLDTATKLPEYYQLYTSSSSSFSRIGSIGPFRDS
jgi:hypothetical protein